MLPEEPCLLCCFEAVSLIAVSWCMQVQGNPLYKEVPDDFMAFLYPDRAPQAAPPAPSAAHPAAASTSTPLKHDWLLDNQAYQNIHGLQVHLACAFAGHTASVNVTLWWEVGHCMFAAGAKYVSRMTQK